MQFSFGGSVCVQVDSEEGIEAETHATQRADKGLLTCVNSLVRIQRGGRLEGSLAFCTLIGSISCVYVHVNV